jgi:hypothetical protein
MLQRSPDLEALTETTQIGSVDVKGSSIKKKLAQLTTQEDRASERALDFYRYIGKSEVDADRLAWSDIQKGFPRLKGYGQRKAVIGMNAQYCLPVL